MSNIIDGKKVANQLAEQLKIKVAELKQDGITPGLAVILVGDDPASQIYVRNKQKRAENLGINFELVKFPETVVQKTLIQKINELNLDPNVDGILVQLPLPKNLDEQEVINTIDPKKDVDGFSPVNFGHLWQNDAKILPATAAGIMKLLNEYQVELTGKDVLIINRSNIVGRPLAALLLNADATVTIAHSKTIDLKQKMRQADIIISAVGQSDFVTGGDLKTGAIVIDVGMNRDQNNKLVGDVDFDSAAEQASLITPVPGGVGPMTIISLMDQVVKIASERLKRG